MAELNLEVHPRQETGKNANNRLRAKGLVPGVVYGAGREALPIQVEKRTLLNLMRSTEGHNPVFLLQLSGTDKSRHAMIREMQIHPVTRHMLHVDFQRVLMTEKVKVAIHLELHGVPVGVKVDGGLLDFVTRELHVQCTPDKIPAKVLVDVSGLHIGQHVEAKDVTLPEGVELLDEPGRVIASVAHHKVEAAATPAAGEGALLETEAAQPEVIKRGGKTDEE
ncbi:MAG TPA: 50S ribosomal protein L25 [Thermoanaerobaculia bacterium]|nr:50S ribosomal protein L25 [Thermoanaerobaculia bacterium]